MIPSPTIPDRLRRAFAPTERGVVGLTEQLLEAFASADVEFERALDQCVCRWTLGGNPRAETVPLPPPAFRTILARIGVLCHERCPNSVTPYGGEGVLAVNGDPSTQFQVAFVNTPTNQQLQLKRLQAEVPPARSDSPAACELDAAQERDRSEQLQS